MIDFNHTLSFIAIVERSVASILLVFFVLPRVYRDVKMKDQYGYLRIGVFLSILFFTFTNTLVLVNNACFFGCLSKNQMVIISVYNASSALFISLALMYIYIRRHK